MVSFYMMVGLPGSGKSHYARKIKTGNPVLIESDEYRERLYGSAKIQGDNVALFEQIHNDIISNLKEKKNVIFDATNISRKHRVALLQKLKSLDVFKECILVATEYDICLERNKSRIRNVGESVISRMRENFNVPLYSEGWDNISIVWSFNRNRYNLMDYILSVNSFEQDNKHHTFTLGQHSQAVSSYCENNTGNIDLKNIALLHDNGKRFTKKFQNHKGETTENAHYYGHAEVGAYESLFYFRVLGYTTYEILHSTGVINYHMYPYNIETEKAKNKLIEIVGDKIYQDIMVLHEADKKAH